MRKSLGSTKPTGAVKVKAGSVGRGGIRGLVAAAHHRPVAASAYARRSKSVHVGTRKMVNYA